MQQAYIDTKKKIVVKIEENIKKISFWVFSSKKSRFALILHCCNQTTIRIKLFINHKYLLGIGQIIISVSFLLFEIGHKVENVKKFIQRSSCFFFFCGTLQPL